MGRERWRGQGAREKRANRDRAGLDPQAEGEKDSIIKPEFVKAKAPCQAVGPSSVLFASIGKGNNKGVTVGRFKRTG